jgi:hypothetical protein
LAYNGTIQQFFIDLEKAYESVRREVLCSSLIELGIVMKLVRLMKMYLNEIYCKVHIGKNVSNTFPVQNGLKQEGTLSPLLLNFALEYGMREVQIK